MGMVLWMPFSPTVKVSDVEDSNLDRWGVFGSNFVRDTLTMHAD